MSHNITKAHRRNSGQTLVIAMLVLMVMAGLGTLFLAIVGRNLRNSQQNAEIVSAEYYAEAGVRYADQRLTYSNEGADWRPVPVDPIDIAADDPDAQWLHEGYTRIDFQKGRSLIRLSYDPQPDNPESRYLKIESIGRIGKVNPNDPTTLTGPETTQKHVLVAYKAIGLTDYMRFVTNKDKRKNLALELGSPVIWEPASAGGEFPSGMTAWDKTPSDIKPLAIRSLLGASKAVGADGLKRFYNDPVFDLLDGGDDGLLVSGAPIRVNGDLKLYGPMDIFLDPKRGQKMEVAGDISLDHSTTSDIYDPNDVNKRDRWAKVWTNDTDSELIYPSNDRFSTLKGLVMDGRDGFDAEGNPRKTAWLEPPLIDDADPVNNVTRYLRMTRNSGVLLDSRTQTGRFGYGRGMYIANWVDQQNGAGFFGGNSLRSEWLNPGSGPNWRGPFYMPPGAIVTFNPAWLGNWVRAIEGNTSASTNAQGFAVELTSGQRWNLPSGQRTSNSLLVCYYRTPGDSSDQTLRYSMYNRGLGRPERIRNPKPLAGDPDEDFPPYNGIIYAEGNLRVKGSIPARQFTVVSGSNIYIEGNLIRSERNSTIALLAQDNVVVNATMFVAPEEMPSFVGGMTEGTTSYQVMQQGTWAKYTFQSAELLSKYGAAASSGLMALLTHSNTGVPGRVPFWANSRSLIGDLKVTAVAPSFQRDVIDIPMTQDANPYLNLNAMAVNNVSLGLETGIGNSGAVFDYNLGRIWVQPLDVRIEALIYAQDGSFAVVAGPWANNNSRDTAENLAMYLNPEDPASVDLSSTAALNRRWQVSGVRDARFPFYAEPVDIRVRLIGSIAENRPMSIQDQRVWLEHWGWIPTRYGSSGNSVPELHITPNPAKPTEDPGASPNLTMEYCFPQLTADADGHYAQLREDEFGRPLPPMPSLPVCPGFVYFGKPR
ncbi:MAG: hypothetical protein ACYC1M_03265 [Armatimonadota bacterium]